MAEINILINKNADSRTADKNISLDKLHEATIEHIEAVSKVMSFLAAKLKEQGKLHDWTKLDYEELFYDNFIHLSPGKEFMNGKWFQKHIHEERHHPNNFCQEDINLLDLLEAIVDRVCADKARIGKVEEISFSPEILMRAVDNTIKLIDKNTKIV